MSKKKLAALAAAVSAAVLLSGCETTDMQVGSPEAKTVATGSAAGSTTANANTTLEHCPAPLGTMSLQVDRDADWYTTLVNDYHLPPPVNLLRLLVQQSNCFVVVERSEAGMRAMDRERQLSDSGETRRGSHYHKGQVVAADYTMSPEITFSTDDAGGFGGLLGGLIGGRRGDAVAQLGANIQTKQASTMLTLIDNRSGVQVAASEGSAAKTDLNLFGSIAGAHGGGSVGGYTSTPQGKVIAAAFMDSYNQMVVSLRAYRAQNVQGQGLGGGGRLDVDGGEAPQQTYTPNTAPKKKLTAKQRRALQRQQQQQQQQQEEDDQGYDDQQQ